MPEAVEVSNNKCVDTLVICIKEELATLVCRDWPESLMSPAPRALATGSRGTQLGQCDVAQNALHKHTCEGSSSIAKPEKSLHTMTNICLGSRPYGGGQNMIGFGV